MRIVTSFAPGRIGRQRYCLDTWLRYGLPVTAVQTPRDVDLVRGHFSGVEFVVDERTGAEHGLRDTPRVRALIEQAHSDAALIINSDISIKDTPSRFAEAWIRPSRDELRVGIRRDFDTVGGKKTLNPHGIDAFLVTPGMLESLPDLGFAVGSPGWDYWLVWQLWREGYSIGVADSTLLHLTHEATWSREEYNTAMLIFMHQYRLTGRMARLCIQELTGRHR